MTEYEALKALADLASSGLERQIADAEAIRQKAESSITLGTGALGAGLAIVGLAVQSIPASLTWVLVVLVAAGGALNLLGLMFLVRSTLAVRADFNVGPSAVWLSEKSRDPDWTQEDLWASTLESWPGIEKENFAILGNAVDKRVAGMRLLMLAMAFYALAFVYVLGIGVAHPPVVAPK